MFVVRGGVLCIAFLSSAPLFAEASATGFALAYPIVVTGRGLPAHKADRAYDVVTIDRSRMLQLASGRLEDVLHDVATTNASPVVAIVPRPSQQSRS